MNINIDDIKLENLSAFFGDGKGYVAVTPEMIKKIKEGQLVITEYQETPLGNVIYLSGFSGLN
jgi:hypothetical protein